jgi:Iap family predicted aminopeptidase
MPYDFTYLVTFLAGALSGAAVNHLRVKNTVRRSEKERAKAPTNIIKRMLDLMPDLISEMEKDIKQDGFETVREFVVLPNELITFNSSGKKRFAYFGNRINNLHGKIEILAHEGLIIDVTSANTPIYRMTEEFIELLKK